MEYKITQLTLEKLEKNFDSLLKTLENLKSTWNTDVEKMKRIFIEMDKSSKTYIAEKNDWEIIWVIKLLIEPKLIRWWVLAWKIEDVSVREWYQWMKIWSKLIIKAIDESKKLWLYKITLSCKKEIIDFYKKLWFENYSINMKMYID